MKGAAIECGNTGEGDPTQPMGREAVRHDHPLFKQYPLDGQAMLSTGPAPTPYQVYAGHGVFIGGTADLAAARELLRPEQVHAVQTESGRALMGLWIFNFTDASLGPHHELQFSLFVSRTALPPVPSRRLGLIELMVARPEVQMLCHGLWNSTPTVVAYNRELLALDARQSESRIERDGQGIRFSVTDKATNVPIVEGRIDRPHRPSLRASLALASRLGLRRLVDIARQPWIAMPVLNPVGEVLPRNAAAETFTKSEVSVLRYFDARRDHLALGDTRYRSLQFQPQFVQFMDGFKFVYLFPK